VPAGGPAPSPVGLDAAGERPGDGSPEHAARLRRLVGRVASDPSRAALVLDFDGTLAPIVAEPARAAPLAGVVPLLHELARRAALVAVVSGRPAAFLSERLEVAAGRSPLRVVGLHGLEELGPQGRVVRRQGAERWAPVVAEACRRLREGAPAGAEVEDKGLSCTLHWRRCPDAGPGAARLGAAVAARLGLVVRAGRRSVELLPPVGADKGDAVRLLLAGRDVRVAAVVGDDLGDLAAFEALRSLAAAGRIETFAVAVLSDETPLELRAAADVLLPGPPAVAELLRALEHATQGTR
jgi:trehalose 6-phosphate phosphatase